MHVMVVQDELAEKNAQLRLALDRERELLDSIGDAAVDWVPEDAPGEDDETLELPPPESVRAWNEDATINLDDAPGPIEPSISNGAPSDESESEPEAADSGAAIQMTLEPDPGVAPIAGAAAEPPAAVSSLAGPSTSPIAEPSLGAGRMAASLDEEVAEPSLVPAASWPEGPYPPAAQPAREAESSPRPEEVLPSLARTAAADSRPTSTETTRSGRENVLAFAAGVLVVLVTFGAGVFVGVNMVRGGASGAPAAAVPTQVPAVAQVASPTGPSATSSAIRPSPPSPLAVVSTPGPPNPPPAPAGLAPAPQAPTIEGDRNVEDAGNGEDEGVEAAPVPSADPVLRSVTTVAADLRVRAQPSTTANILRSMPLGARLDVIPGTAQDPVFQWIRVRTTDGVVGWVVTAGVQ